MISRKTKIILVLLLLLYFVLNLLFVCRYYSQETLLNCYSIEQFRDSRADYASNIYIGTMRIIAFFPFDFKMPIVDNYMARPLSGPFYYFAASVLKSFGYSGSLLFPLQVVNLIFSCLALLFVFLLLFRLSKNLTASILGVLLVAFSFCFWYWGTSVKSYSITTALLFLSLYLLLHSRWYLTLLAGVFMGLAIGFTHTAVIFIPAAVLIYLLQKAPAIEKALNGTAFLLLSISLTLLWHVLFYYMYFEPANLPATVFRSEKVMQWTRNTASSPLDISRLKEASGPERSRMIKTQIERIWKRFSQMSILPVTAKGDQLYTYAPMPGMVEFLFKASGIMLAVIMILSIFFVKGWKQNSFLLFTCLIWVLTPLVIFFFADADNDYTYIAAFGLIFFIAAAGSFSKILRFSLITWIGLIAFINIWVAYPLSRENTNPMLSETGKLAGKIESGSQLAYFDPNFSRRGEDIYLAYYSRAKMRIVLPHIRDKFPLNSREIVVNQSELEYYPGITEEARKSFVDFLKNSGYRETDKFSFGEDIFAVYKKNKGNY